MILAVLSSHSALPGGRYLGNRGRPTVAGRPCRAGPCPQGLPAGARHCDPTRPPAGALGSSWAPVDAPARGLGRVVRAGRHLRGGLAQAPAPQYPWLLWLLGELIAPPRPPRPLPPPAGRLLLVDASCLHQPGGTGDDWRLHLAYDFIAGRMAQVHVTDASAGNAWIGTPGRLASAVLTTAMAIAAVWPWPGSSRPT